MISICKLALTLSVVFSLTLTQKSLAMEQEAVVVDWQKPQEDDVPANSCLFTKVFQVTLTEGQLEDILRAVATDPNFKIAKTLELKNAYIRHWKREGISSKVAEDIFKNHLKFYLDSNTDGISHSMSHLSLVKEWGKDLKEQDNEEDPNQ